MCSQIWDNAFLLVTVVRRAGPTSHYQRAEDSGYSFPVATTPPLTARKTSRGTIIFQDEYNSRRSRNWRFVGYEGFELPWVR